MDPKESCPMCGDAIWIRHRRRAPLQRCDYCTSEEVHFSLVLEINPEFVNDLTTDEKIETISSEMARAFVHIGREFNLNGK